MCAILSPLVFEHFANSKNDFYQIFATCKHKCVIFEYMSKLCYIRKVKKRSKMTQIITHAEPSYNFLKLPEQMNASFELKAFICLNRYHKNFDTFIISEFTCRNKFMLMVNKSHESSFLLKFNFI